MQEKTSAWPRCRFVAGLVALVAAAQVRDEIAAQDFCASCGSPRDGLAPVTFSMRWVSTADLAECRLEGQADIALAWGGTFQSGDGRCHRRAAASVENLRLDSAAPEGCATGLELGSELDSVLAFDAADAAACFPGIGTLEVPVVLATTQGTLRTAEPVSLKTTLDSPSVAGTVFSKAAPLIVLVDPAKPDAGPAGFIVRFDVRFLSCACFPAAPLAPRMALLDGAARLKLYGPSKGIVLDLSGRAVLDRSGGSPRRGEGGLECTEDVRIEGLEMEAVDPLLGRIAVKSRGPIEGVLTAPAEGCEPAPPSFRGVLDLDLPGFFSELTAGEVALSWDGGAALARGPSILRIAGTLPLYRIGDPEKQPVGEFAELTLRLEPVEVPRCLPVEERSSFPVQLDLGVKLGAEPERSVSLRGHLALARTPDPVSASTTLRLSIRDLHFGGDHADLGEIDCMHVRERPAHFDLSSVDPGKCAPQFGRIGFVPALRIGDLDLEGDAPLEFEGTMESLGSPGSVANAIQGVSLVNRTTRKPVGSIAGASLRWILPLRGRAEDLPRTLLRQRSTRIELPVDFNLGPVDVEVEIDLLHSQLNNLEIVLFGPDGSSAILLRAGTLQASDPASRLRARFSRQGRPLAPPLGRDDLLEPAEPAAFSALQNGGGFWAVEILQTASEPMGWGVLAELRLNFFRRGSLPESAPLLEDLSLTSVFCTPFLRWSGPPQPSEFRFIQDGRLMPLAIAPDQLSLFDPSPQTSAGLVQYAAVDPGQSALLGLLEVRLLPVPSVEALLAREEGGGLKLTWSSPVEYQAIRLTLDGAPLVSLPGSATNHQLSAGLARGKLVGVSGILCGNESEPRYPPLAPERSLDGVSCRLVGTLPELTIEGVGPYKNLRIYRNAVFVAEIPGYLRSFADRGFTPRPQQGINYCVEPVYQSGKAAEQSCCSLHLPQPLLPQCTVLLPGRTVKIDVLGEVESFDRIVILRDDLVAFEVRGGSVVLDETPPATLETSVGVTYYLTSHFQGVVYPYTSCFVVRPPARGDCNSDSRIDLSDALGILFVLFLGEKPPCETACDANGADGLDIADAIFLLQHLFLQGAPPPPTAMSCRLQP